MKKKGSLIFESKYMSHTTAKNGLMRHATTDRAIELIHMEKNLSLTCVYLITLEHLWDILGRTVCDITPPDLT